jgi:hypothetical protein
MARTSKTRIGESDRDASKRQAAAAGGAERQRAQEGLSRARAQGRQELAQGARDISAGIERHRASEDLERVRGSQEQAQRFGQEVQSQQLSMQAANQGLDQSPEAQAKLQALQSEMDRGERQMQEQMQQPLEMAGEGPTSQFQPAFQQGEARMQAETDKAEAEKVKAYAYKLQAETAYMKAKMAGDAEGMTKAKGQLSKNFKRSNEMLSRWGKGGLSESDWAYLETRAEGMQDAEGLAAIQVREQNSPRVRDMISADKDYEAAWYMASTGELPKGSEDADGVWDFSSPMMGQITQAASAIKAQIAASPLKSTLKFDSAADAQRWLNKLAAQMIIAGVPVASQEQAGMDAQVQEQQQAQGQTPPALGGASEQFAPQPERPPTRPFTPGGGSSK